MHGHAAELKRRAEWLCDMNDSTGLLFFFKELHVNDVKLDEIGLDDRTLKICKKVLEHFKEKSGWTPSDPLK